MAEPYYFDIGSTAHGRVAFFSIVVSSASTTVSNAHAYQQTYCAVHAFLHQTQGLKAPVVSGSVYGEISSWYNADIEAVAAGAGGQRLELVLGDMQIEGQCVCYYLIIFVQFTRLLKYFR